MFIFELCLGQISNAHSTIKSTWTYIFTSDMFLLGLGEIKITTLQKRQAVILKILILLLGLPVTLQFYENHRDYNISVIWSRICFKSIY